MRSDFEAGSVLRRWRRRAAPFHSASELRARPREALVQMAEVARVRSSPATSLSALGTLGLSMRCERMPLKSAYDVYGMWHATHELPLDDARVTAVLARALRDLAVTASARGVHVVARAELVVRFAPVHRMARKTRNSVLLRAARVASGRRERVVLAAADAHRAVRPERAFGFGFGAERRGGCASVPAAPSTGSAWRCRESARGRAACASARARSPGRNDVENPLFHHVVSSFGTK